MPIVPYLSLTLLLQNSFTLFYSFYLGLLHHPSAHTLPPPPPPPLSLRLPQTFRDKSSLPLDFTVIHATLFDIVGGNTQLYFMLLFRWHTVRCLIGVQSFIKTE